MKIIAMYLPQFHQVKENDVWWGEGFTEWTAVKSAEKLYKEHNQPRIPWNENYYNLLEKETMEWQAQLMKQYGIDGMCIYHYWFKDGKQILEKPAENLLHWDDIDMPYCFCWANETWARSWSRIQEKNSWADQFEKNGSAGESGILLEQNYGWKDQWKHHFYYLLPFFRDPRYICIDEKPVFLIYKAGDIFCLPQMLELWNTLAVKEGLKGIYVIGAGCCMENISCMNGRMYAEPGHSYGLLRRERIHQENGVRIVDYDDVWQQVLSGCQQQNMYLEGFVGYDDTPRRGKNGLILQGAEPEKFLFYLSELLAKSAANGCQYVFLNAWNEWGEGMYLEPDMSYGTAYLEAVVKAKALYALQEERDIENTYGKFSGQSRSELEKNQLIKKILDRWLTLYEENINIDLWFQKNNFKKVAIYGYGILGRHFYKQLRGSTIELVYVIDQQKDWLDLEADIYAPTDDLPAVDCIVVTVCYDFEDIYRILTKKGMQNIVSLATILFD